MMTLAWLLLAWTPGSAAEFAALNVGLSQIRHSAPPDPVEGAPIPAPKGTSPDLFSLVAGQLPEGQPGEEGGAVQLVAFTEEPAPDADLALAQSLASAVRGAFTSPNRRGVSLTGFPGDLAFGMRRRLGMLQLEGPLDTASPAALYQLGWSAGQSWVGQPRAHCGELAAAVHTFIIWDRLSGPNVLNGRITHWRVVSEANRDHAWNMVKINGRWFKVDAWEGSAAALPTDGSDLPTGTAVHASPVYSFR